MLRIASCAVARLRTMIIKVMIIIKVIKMAMIIYKVIRMAIIMMLINLKTFEPSQVLQDAWQARQVPAPEYIPGMHSLSTIITLKVFPEYGSGVGWKWPQKCRHIICLKNILSEHPGNRVL